MPTRRFSLSLAALFLLLVLPGAALARARTRIVHLKVGPFPIQAHRDREVCRVVRVPSVAGMQLESWEARSRISRRGLVGTHHFVAYGYSGTDSRAFPGPSELVDDPGCSSLGPADFFKKRVFLAGSGGESVTPAGRPSASRGSRSTRSSCAPRAGSTRTPPSRPCSSSSGA